MTTRNLDIYKPRQELLLIDDEILELWYGIIPTEFLRLIEKCDISIGDSYATLNIRYSFNNTHVCTYIVNDKIFVIFSIAIHYSNLINHKLKEILHLPNITHRILNDSFNYQIDDVW